MGERREISWRTVVVTLEMRVMSLDDEDALGTARGVWGGWLIGERFQNVQLVGCRLKEEAE